MVRPLRSALVACFAVAASLPVETHAVNCPGQPGNLVEIAMNWCGGDHGFNEGATCGLNALGRAGLSGLPALASDVVLGNTWDRTNMMGATKLAARSGKIGEAVNAAICCQVHNPGVHTCLQQHRGEVEAWLRANCN